MLNVRYLEAILELYEGAIEPTWANLEPTWPHDGFKTDRIEENCTLLEASRRILEASWAFLEAC